MLRWGALTVLGSVLAFALAHGRWHPHPAPASLEVEAFLSRAPGVYLGLFPGISLRVSPHRLGVEYDWIVAPGADPGAISMSFPGASVSMGPGGNLFVHRPGRVVPHTTPHAYQTIRGQRVPVDARFTVPSNTTAGFQLGPYDAAHELVIDPVVIFSLSLSGSWTTWITGTLLSDEITAVATDARGFTYVTGTARSSDFPTTEGAFQRELRGESDLFIAKIDPEGNLVFSTRIGGSGGEYGNTHDPDAPNGAMAVDTAGNIYVYGVTYSPDFPGLSPSGGVRGVIAKVRADGRALLFTLSPGLVRSMAFDPAGNLWFGGWGGGLGVTPGALQTTPGGGYINKISPTGELLYGTYLGRTPTDRVEAIAVDPQGNVYAAGWTFSPDFLVTPSAFLRKFPTEFCEPPFTFRCTAGFVIKMNASGTALAYSTFLGGSEPSFALGVAADARGRAYVTGATHAPDFPLTPDAYQSERGRTYAAFLSRLDPTGSRLEYSTYLGGGRPLATVGGNDQGRFLTLAGDFLYLAGTASNLTFPEVNPIQLPLFNRCGNRPCTNTFLSVFRAADMQPVFSTHLGSAFDDQVRGMAVDGAGNVVVASECLPSPDFFSTTPAYAPAFPLAGSKRQHNFITKIALDGPAVPIIRSTHDAADLTRNVNGPLVGGKIFTVFGRSISARPGVVASTSLPLPTALDGVSIEIAGRPVPLYAVANVDGVEQINFLMPWGIPETVPTRFHDLGMAHLVVNNNGSRSLPFVADLRSPSWPYPFRPTLFRDGDGAAIAIRAQDGVPVAKEKPARPGEIVVLFASGLGPVDPPVKAGDAAPADPLSWTVHRPAVTFGGMAGEVLFCGLAPGFAGLYQINVRIPLGAPKGRVPIEFIYEGERGALPGAPIEISE